MERRAAVAGRHPDQARSHGVLAGPARRHLPRPELSRRPSRQWRPSGRRPQSVTRQRAAVASSASDAPLRQMGMAAPRPGGQDLLPSPCVRRSTDACWHKGGGPSCPRTTVPVPRDMSWGEGADDDQRRGVQYRWVVAAWGAEGPAGMVSAVTADGDDRGVRAGRAGWRARRGSDGLCERHGPAGAGNGGMCPAWPAPPPARAWGSAGTPPGGWCRSLTACPAPRWRCREPCSLGWLVPPPACAWRSARTPPSPRAWW